MIIVKKSFLSVLLLFLLSFLLSSCSKAPGIGTSEVDLKNKLSVQLEYRQFIYNCELHNCEDGLTISFYGNGDFPDGFTVVCDDASCTLSYEGLSQKFDCSKLPEDYLPVVLKSFFDSFDGFMVTEGYDERKNCNYIKRTVRDSFVTFEVYEGQEGNTRYNIIIN